MPEEVAGSSPALRTTPKLYVVGRRDLSPGLRAAQIGHALIHWVLEHGRPPDNLVVLEVMGQKELEALLELPQAVGFYEPDLCGQLTAVAAGPEARRRLSGLPLLR